VSGKFGSIVRGIRDDELRVRFLGYPVEVYKLVVFTLSAMICGVAGALYYPQAGIINPDEIAPIASIYLAVWVAIGGRGRLYGAVIGAAVVSLLSTFFTSGRAPDVDLGFYRDQLDRLVAGAAWPRLRAGDALRTQGSRGSLRLPRAEGGHMSTLLEVSGVSVSFDGFKAINNLSFTIGLPEMRAVIGPNGAGKTTFMDIVTGKTRPDDGHRALGRDGPFAPVPVRGADRARGDRPQVPAAHRVRGPERARQPARGAEETARPLQRDVRPGQPGDRAGSRRSRARSALRTS
jgi:hypothetical protein